MAATKSNIKKKKTEKEVYIFAEPSPSPSSQPAERLPVKKRERMKKPEEPPVDTFEPEQELDSSEVKILHVAR